MAVGSGETRSDLLSQSQAALPPAQDALEEFHDAIEMSESELKQLLAEAANENMASNLQADVSAEKLKSPKKVSFSDTPVVKIFEQEEAPEKTTDASPIINLPRTTLSEHDVEFCQKFFFLEKSGLLKDVYADFIKESLETVIPANNIFDNAILIYLGTPPYPRKLDGLIFTESHLGKLIDLTHQAKSLFEKYLPAISGTHSENHKPTERHINFKNGHRIAPEAQVSIKF